MNVEIIDDLFSVGHVVLGALTVIVGLWILVVYVAYQTIESCIKREKWENTLGDIVEFFFGAGVASLCLRSLL